MDLILTGRPVTAKEGLEVGLVNRLREAHTRVVQDGFARSAAEALAATIAAFPQVKSFLHGLGVCGTRPTKCVRSAGPDLPPGNDQ